MAGIPYVIEQDEKGKEKSYDLYSRLLKDRIIFVTGVFQGPMANAIVAQLLFLEMQDSDEDIYMYVNSPGGEISAMNAVYDTMNYIKNDVSTLGLGQVASAAAFIVAAGAKGKRIALPNCEFMIHELSGGVQGKATDMELNLKHSLYLREKMARQFVEMTGQPLDKIKTDMERDYWLPAAEALEYGLVDKIQETKN